MVLVVVVAVLLGVMGALAVAVAVLGEVLAELPQQDKAMREARLLARQALEAVALVLLVVPAALEAMAVMVQLHLFQAHRLLMLEVAAVELKLLEQVVLVGLVEVAVGVITLLPLVQREQQIQAVAVAALEIQLQQAEVLEALALSSSATQAHLLMQQA